MCELDALQEAGERNRVVPELNVVHMRLVINTASGLAALPFL